MNVDSAFFLFCFFPVLLLLYYAVKRTQLRNVILLIAGFLFYSFGGLFDLLILLFMAMVTWSAGRLIRTGRAKKAVLTVCVTINIGLLAAFKLLERVTVTVFGPDAGMRLFFADISPVTLTAPLGVSFFVFKCVSYAVDIYRDSETGKVGFLSFLMYVSFFPELTAGPISRYRDFEPMLEQRKVTATRAADGITRLIRGLGKKLLISGAAGSVADAVFAFDGTMDIRLAWVGAISYAIQIFFDFSGYSDMAIGLAGVFGFTSPENFNYPYTASSIGDFWRRWHMSLSGWLRDYVYIPLGGNRKGKYRTALNRFIVFLLCGLWHGFGLTYVIWGAWHGALSAAEGLRILDVDRWRKRQGGRALSHVYTLLAVMLGFVMFRADSAIDGVTVIGAMFAGFDFTADGSALLERVLDLRCVFYMLVGAVFCCPVAGMIGKRLNRKWMPALRYCAYAALYVLCLTSLAAGGFSPFIYARF